jgi:ATP-binding cassette subfamily B (MDR/TAP) protein 1
VTFAYPSKPDTQVLKEVDLKVPQGKVIALVGSSGCGKSSIINMILRFYDPQNGHIYFENHNLKILEPRWYHN